MGPSKGLQAATGNSEERAYQWQPIATASEKCLGPLNYGGKKGGLNPTNIKNAF